MPRPPRVHVPGGLYHLTLRGNHREPLFGGVDDREMLNEIVSTAIAKLRAQVHCFCWMHNHLHFVMQVSAAPTGKVMQRIAMRYSRYRHRRLFLTGHLFERRYWARVIEDDAYFMQLLRYIHLNPVEAGLAYEPADYRWSSHRSYLGRESIPWLTTESGLALFGDDVESARAEYVRFMAEGVPPNGAGLASLPYRPHVPTEAAARAGVVQRCVEQERVSLDELAEQTCRKHGIDMEELRSRSRRRALSRVRAEFASSAIEVGTSLKAASGLLGRDPSVVLRLIERHRDR